MEYYKKYRITENANLADKVNHIIYFFHHLPLIGKYTGDKYKAYAFKKFIFAIGPILNIIDQILKCIFTFFIALFHAGFLLWLIKGSWYFPDNIYNDFVDLALTNLGFLSFYLAPAVLSNSISRGKVEIHKLNKQYKMLAKESGLIQGVFDPLRIGIGRVFAFTIFLGFKNGFLISFILAFIRIISNAFTLSLLNKKDKIYADKTWVNIIVFIILFAGLMLIKDIDSNILMLVFTITLIISIFASKYLLKFDEYGKLLEDAKLEDTDMNVDLDQIANDSLALKDTDIKTDKKENGRGYELLNNLFFARHNRVIVKPILKKAGILFAIIITLIAFTKYKQADFNFDTLNILIISQPIFMYLLYYNPNINRAMFLNCDRPLLQYGFYREEKAIFTMYKLRYKTVLKIKMLSLLTGILVNVLNFIVFEKFYLRTLIYCEIFVLVSFLFYVSLDLFLYYIFQPFNYEATNIGKGYKFANSLLGYLNVLFIPLIISKLSISGQIVLLVLSYVMFALIIIFHLLVKIYGKKTFRIRN